jgi:hypothetical protein
MTDEINDLLAAAGHVEQPRPDVLDEAREHLWTAIAQEMVRTNVERGPASPVRERSDAPERGSTTHKDQPGK